MSEGRKDEAHISAEWEIRASHIDGVKTREVRNVVTANGITTELHRPDWGIVNGSVEQVIHVALRGRAVSAWHQHRHRWDGNCRLPFLNRQNLSEQRRRNCIGQRDRHE